MALLIIFLTRFAVPVSAVSREPVKKRLQLMVYKKWTPIKIGKKKAEPAKILPYKHQQIPFVSDTIFTRTGDMATA
jgi:hypothetical protein